MTATTPGPWDPGLQNERTTMAWLRTALALVGAGALVAKQSGSIPVAGAVMAAVALAAGSMIREAEHRYHARGEALATGGPVVALRHVAATALTASVLAACALVIVVA